MENPLFNFLTPFFRKTLIWSEVFRAFVWDHACLLLSKLCIYWRIFRISCLLLKKKTFSLPILAKMVNFWSFSAKSNMIFFPKVNNLSKKSRAIHKDDLYRIPAIYLLKPQTRYKLHSRHFLEKWVKKGERGISHGSHVANHWILQCIHSLQLFGNLKGEQPRISLDKNIAK